MAKCIVCRCEDVTDQEIREAVQNGYADMESLKRYLAIGTGACQGKYCMVRIALILEEQSGQSVEGIPPYVSRPPMSMTALSFFAAKETPEDRYEG
jgi:bacterioferritin-associated ferredoxin